MPSGMYHRRVELLVLLVQLGFLLQQTETQGEGKVESGTQGEGSKSVGILWSDSRCDGYFCLVDPSFAATPAHTQATICAPATTHEHLARRPLNNPTTSSASITKAP